MRHYMIKNRFSSNVRTKIGISAPTALVVSLDLRIRTASHHSVPNIFHLLPISMKINVMKDGKNVQLIMFCSKNSIDGQKSTANHATERNLRCLKIGDE